MASTREAVSSGSWGSSDKGFPFLMEQKPQARVHTSPNSKKSPSHGKSNGFGWGNEPLHTRCANDSPEAQLLNRVTGSKTSFLWRSKPEVARGYRVLHDRSFWKTTHVPNPLFILTDDRIRPFSKPLQALAFLLRRSQWEI